MMDALNIENDIWMKISQLKTEYLIIQYNHRQIYPNSYMTYKVLRNSNLKILSVSYHFWYLILNETTCILLHFSLLNLNVTIHYT